MTENNENDREMGGKSVGGGRMLGKTKTKKRQTERKWQREGDGWREREKKRVATSGE